MFLDPVLYLTYIHPHTNMHKMLKLKAYLAKINLRTNIPEHKCCRENGKEGQHLHRDTYISWLIGMGVTPVILYLLI